MREPILQDAVDLLVDLTTTIDEMLREHLVAPGHFLATERLSRRCHEYLKKAADLPPFEAETVGCLVELPLDGSLAVYVPPEGFPHCCGALPITYPVWKTDERGNEHWVQHPALVVTWTKRGG